MRWNGYAYMRHLVDIKGDAGLVSHQGKGTKHVSSIVPTQRPELYAKSQLYRYLLFLC
jgi:hypothetical protein